MRPRDGVQRGSVMDMPLYPGDPLTPGVGATPDAQRLDRKDATSLTKIPVLPISYGDAQPLLAGARRSGGAARVARRRCRSPTTSGPGPAKVHLELAFNWDLKPVYDVIARIPGVRAARPVDHPRQPSRRLGERRRGSDLRPWSRCWRRRAALGELLKQGWQPEAHHHLLRLGRRRAEAARLDRVGRGARGRAARSTRSSTSTPTATAAATWAWAARTRWSASSTTWRRT